MGIPRFQPGTSPDIQAILKESGLFSYLLKNIFRWGLALFIWKMGNLIYCFLQEFLLLLTTIRTRWVIAIAFPLLESYYLLDVYCRPPLSWQGTEWIFSLLLSLLTSQMFFLQIDHF